METRTITIQELLGMNIDRLCHIQVPMMFKRSIADPISIVIEDLQNCIEAMNNMEKQKAEAAKAAQNANEEAPQIEILDAGMVDEIPQEEQ